MIIRHEVAKRLNELSDDEFFRVVDDVAGREFAGGDLRVDVTARLMRQFNADQPMRRRVCDELGLPTPEEYPAVLAAKSVAVSQKSADAAERSAGASVKSANAADASATAAREALGIGENRLMEATKSNVISVVAAFIAVLALLVAVFK